MDRIRFTLVEDGQDIRPYDFDTQTIQIGADPDRGDNLLIDLPKTRRHVRAKIFRQADYVEMEVIAGPVWLQGSKMEDGDVAELNVGDILIFGTKKPQGVRLRFEYATEAEIIMDDVADWTVSSAKKPKRGGNAEDDAFLFEEEVDEYEGLNPWQKYLLWYRKQYAKFAKWRKKAARVKYWISLVQMIMSKAGKILAIGAGAVAIGGGYWMQIQAKLNAQEAQEVAEEREKAAVLAEKQSTQARHELEELNRQCGCGSSEGVDQGALVAANEILTRFGDGDDALAPERAYPMPNRTMVSMASLISGPLNGARRSRTKLQNTLDRVCSPTKDKERMDLVQQEVNRYGLHEAYSFIPFVESLWCEMAVSFTGPRGMMQFTRATAAEAFRKVDATQANIPNYDWNGHHKWLVNKSRQFGGYYGMLAKCPALVRSDYKRHFYKNETNPSYPKRLDPRDPRTDWEWSTKAAFSWLETLDSKYKSKGFREMDSLLLAMTAYNQGEGEVQRWIKTAMKRYGKKKEAALSYPEVYGGGMELWMNESNTEKKRQIKEGMQYAPKILGNYLYAAPKLDSMGCR